MALVLGTNCGFVAVAPTDDPAGSAATCDTYLMGFKDTAPATAVKINEIGWWCDNATEAANFEVGIYTHDAGGDIPLTLLSGASQTNAKGTTAGWKKATGLNIAITGGSIYWLALQLDDTATATQFNYAGGSGKEDQKWNITTLPSSWGSSNNSNARLNSIYAVWEAAASTPETSTPTSLGSGWVGTSKKKKEEVKNWIIREPILTIARKE